MSDDKKQSVTATIDAPPDKVFAVVADPARHADIDGSAMCVSSETGPITAAGQSFMMDMYRDGLGKYQIRNEVTELEPGKRFAWRTNLQISSPELDALFGEMKPGGTTWRYELEPTADGKTKVTHTNDWSTLYDERVSAICPYITTAEMSGTLAKLGEIVAKG